MSRQLGQSLVRTVVVSLLWLLAIGGAANADPIRFPQDSDVAFFVELAPGWQWKPNDAASTNLLAPDSSSNVSLMLLDDPDRAKMLKDDPQGFARAELGRLNAEPISARDTARVAGLTASVFSSRMTNPSGTTLNLKMVLLPVANRYVVEVVTAAITDLTDRQRRSLDAALQGIAVGRPIGSD